MSDIQRVPVSATIVCGSLALSGCLCGTDASSSSPLGPRELVAFDFTSKPRPALLGLWPAESSAPARKKRELLTSQHGADLVATTDGVDGWFDWEFEKPIRAGALRLDVDSDKDGMLQLFWATDECKVFEERCSASEPIKQGRQSVDFVLDPAHLLRGLRLDLPAERGVKLAFHAVRLLERPWITPRYEARAQHTEVTPTSEGLRIACKRVDPWLTFPSSRLETSSVESVELELAAPPGAHPKLYWRGTACANFSESCQVVLTPIAGKNDAFSARLTGLPSWRGKVEELRLDPDDGPGQYVLRNLVLVRSGAKS